MAGKRRKKIREPEIPRSWESSISRSSCRSWSGCTLDGCARDKAGNRSLHFDQYCTLILLYLFNPVVTSLRGLQQASELGKVQKKLGCPHLLSHDEHGIEIQTYCAIIACMTG